jgi:hypothetical protein
VQINAKPCKLIVCGVFCFMSQARYYPSLNPVSKNGENFKIPVLLPTRNPWHCFGAKRAIDSLSGLINMAHREQSLGRTAMSVSKPSSSFALRLILT